MKENLSVVQVDKLDQKLKPFRGDVKKPVARVQLQQFLPDLFTKENNDKDNSIIAGLFPKNDKEEVVHIHSADAQQIRYSFKHCELAGVLYPLVELMVYHQQFPQWRNGYIYGGWSVRLQMGCPLPYQREPPMLHVQWNGEEKLGASHELEMGYIDMNGNGQNMVLNLQDKTLSLPHVQRTMNFSDIDQLKTMQGDQPFVFEHVALSESLVGVAFHGNEINKIGSQNMILPAVMHAFYASS